MDVFQFNLLNVPNHNCCRVVKCESVSLQDQCTDIKDNDSVEIVGLGFSSEDVANNKVLAARDHELEHIHD